jgi:hypothetical protein
LYSRRVSRSIQLIYWLSPGRNETAAADVGSPTTLPLDVFRQRPLTRIDAPTIPSECHQGGEARSQGFYLADHLHVTNSTNDSGLASRDDAERKSAGGSDERKRGSGRCGSPPVEKRSEPANYVVPTNNNERDVAVAHVNQCPLRTAADLIIR